MFKLRQNKMPIFHAFTVFLLLILLGVSNGYSQSPGTVAGNNDSVDTVMDIDFSTGLNLAYHSVPVLIGDDDIANTLEYTYLALQVDVGLLDFLTIGVVAGFNSNRLTKPVEFDRLPLSLMADGERFNSMIFGIRAQADLLTWKDFSLAAHGDIRLIKRFSKDLPIQLDIVEGTATLKNSFQHLTLDLLVQYDGYSGLTLFAGPQLQIVNGKMTVSELLGNIDAEAELSYHQEKAMGITAGAYYELGGNWDISAKITLLAQTSLSVTLFYVF
jgi:hypothetical protein